MLLELVQDIKAVRNLNKKCHCHLFISEDISVSFQLFHTVSVSYKEHIYIF